MHKNFIYLQKSVCGRFRTRRVKWVDFISKSFLYMIYKFTKGNKYIKHSRHKTHYA